MAEKSESKTPDINPQEIIYAYQYLQEQEAMISDQLRLLASQIQGVDITLETLDGLKDIPSGHEILVPIGPSAYVKAIVPNPNEILQHASKEVVIQKDIIASIESMQKIQKNYQAIKENLLQKHQEVVAKLQQIEPVVNHLYNSQAGRME